MIHIRKTRFCFSLFVAFAIIFFALAYPEFSKNALLDGLHLCTEQLLLAIFPFLIVAQLLVLSGAITPLGYIFLPLVKILGFNSKNIGGIILLQLIGGFAPAVNALSQAVRTHKISAEEASRLLPVIVCMGPSFIVLAVGVSDFNSSVLGYYLFISQILACWLVALIFRFILPPIKHTVAVINNTHTETTLSQTQVKQDNQPFSSMVADSFFAFLRLCAVVIFMRFFSAGLYQILPTNLHLLPALLLEVTSGTAVLSNSGRFASYFVCACLSLQGISVLLQVSALCPSNVSLKYLYISRIIHLPISLLIFWLLLLIPNTQNVYNSLAPRLIAMQRISTEQALLVFIVCIFTAYHLQKNLLPKQK